MAKVVSDVEATCNVKILSLLMRMSNKKFSLLKKRHHQNNAPIPILPEMLTFVRGALVPGHCEEIRPGVPSHVILSELLKLPKPLYYRTVRTQVKHLTLCLHSPIADVGY